MIINIILLNRLITSDFKSSSSSSGAVSDSQQSTSNESREKLTTPANGGLNQSLANGIRASVAANTIMTHSKFD